MSDFCHLPPYRVSFPSAPQAVPDGVDWAVAAYGIPGLWKHAKGDGVTVAVIDSGVAPHEALKDAVADYRNFSSDSDVYDTLGHGTHVAGVIGARSGMARGIAPGATLISLKVLGHSGMGSNEAVATAVHHATEAKVDIICMSLGSTTPDGRLHQAIREACAAGVVVVCAAGNDGGSVNYPAAFAETLAVGAVDKDGRVCQFSSRGKEIVVAAPGQDITSTWLSNGYATVSGTSMAAPFVAGVLALWASDAKANKKKLNHSEAVRALAETCRDVGAPGRDPEYGWGLMNPSSLITYTAAASTEGVTIFIPGARII